MKHRTAAKARMARKGFLGRLRTYFLAGILVTFPISITLLLAWKVVDYIDVRVTTLIPVHYNPETYLPFGLPGLGIIIIFVALTLVGFLTANFVGHYFVRISEAFLARMPVIRTIYGAVKQIFETVLAHQSDAFRQVVLVEYPRHGVWAIGFITGKTLGEIQNATSDQMMNVFLPTTPNPTSGFLLFIPKKDLYVLDMTVEEGIKMVISSGIITPPDRRPDKDKDKNIVTPHTDKT